MFEVGVVANFTARHALHGDFGPASQMHAHDYRVEAAAFGGQLRGDGTLFDITRLDQALASATAELDRRELNEIPGLAEPNPSAEVVARYVFERVAPALAGQGLERLEVRVWESPRAYAGYAGRLD